MNLKVDSSHPHPGNWNFEEKDPLKKILPVKLIYFPKYFQKFRQIESSKW